MGRLKLMLSHPSIALMAAIAVISAIWLALTAPGWVWLALPVGLAMQYLNEYALHRFIFHMTPPRRQWAFDLLYRAHYGHHDFPGKPALFFVPGWVALPILAINTVLVGGVLGLAGVAEAWPLAVAGVCVGGIITFLIYEWFHMTAHLTVPKMRLERHVTALHNQHHFRDFRRWFHVSPGGEIIDRAMGTAIDREALRAQARAEFILTLGLQPDDARLVAARTRLGPRYGLTADEIARAARR